MQPGQRLVAGSGNQVAYVAPANTRVPPSTREAELARERLALQQQQATEQRAQIQAMPYLPPTRVPLGSRVPTVWPTTTPYYAPVNTPANAQARAPLGKR